MATISRSVKAYLERKRLVETRRGPAPRFHPGSSQVHSLELSPPLPLIQFVLDTNGEPPPDGGLTTPWPHGVSVEQT